MKPKLFIASSGEQLATVDHVVEIMSQWVEPIRWSGTFRASTYNLENLERHVKAADFALAIFHPDDAQVSRGVPMKSVRDNVLFEWGMFVGALGRKRCFAIRPQDSDLHVPTDISGLEKPFYRCHSDGSPDIDSLRHACLEVWRAICWSLGERPMWISRFQARRQSLHAETHITTEDAYKLILYMFEEEVFSEFVALDVAFERWHDLVEDQDHEGGPLGYFDTFTPEIIQACKHLFASGRCRNFRRIFVIDSSDLHDQKTLKTLKKIRGIEEGWRKGIPGLMVESRVLVWHRTKNPGVRDKVARLCDFALFIGDLESMAVVEPGLKSPINGSQRYSCEIKMAKDALDHMKFEFDELWSIHAKSIDEVVGPIAESGTGGARSPSEGSPVSHAFRLFEERRAEVRLPCVVIVETDYIDSRDAAMQIDRQDHRLDAAWFMSKLSGFSGSDLLVRDVAFVNDLEHPACAKACEPLPPIKIDKKDDFRGHSAVFWMRKTRNAFLKKLKKWLQDGRPDLERSPPSNPGQIVVATRNGEIHIAHYANGKSGQLVARCAGLMAQHYFDLYTMAKKVAPGVRDVWIFDFNLDQEGEAVARGAGVFERIYFQDEIAIVHIVNVNYSGALAMSGGVAHFKIGGKG